MRENVADSLGHLKDEVSSGVRTVMTTKGTGTKANKTERVDLSNTTVLSTRDTLREA